MSYPGQRMLFLAVFLLAEASLAILGCEDGGESWQRNVDRLLGTELPQSTQENKVHFYLYTRDSPSSSSARGGLDFFSSLNKWTQSNHLKPPNSQPQLTDKFPSRDQEYGPIISEVTDPKLFNGAFDPDKPTIVLIPGYKNTPQTSEFANTTRRAYLDEYDGQVVIAFWDAAKGNYTEARSNITSVAIVVTRFLTRMVSEERLDLDATPLMGHSLGAHIAGTTGKMLKGKIRTLIGLDPANVLFVPGGKDTISSGSAQFVQIIHTSNTAEGLLQPVGHADFYVNGDFPPQPGCENLEDFLWTLCSHLRAFIFYDESIRHPANFLASKCSDYERFRSGECDNNEKVYLGQNTTRSARGKYFLRTRASAPFGLGSEGSKGQGKVPELTPLNSTEEHSVHFWLVNRKTRNDPIKSNITDERLFGGVYNSQKPTIILIPGYGDTPESSPFADQLEGAFLKQADYELIVIYWDAATADYRVAVDEFVNVARVISQFLGRMEKEENLALSSLTMIGHSSGAQIGGTAGRFVKGKIKTLVGLDSVSPLVKPGGYNVIDKNSAEFVLLIHSSASVLGILQPLGHVDFYPNTGLPPQPGCESSDYLLPINPVCALCSHLRAIELYAESIQNPTAFPATKCSSYQEAAGQGVCTGPSTVFMGYNTSRSARGIYYLRTRSSSPFGLGNAGAGNAVTLSV